MVKNGASDKRFLSIMSAPRPLYPAGLLQTVRVGKYNKFDIMSMPVSSNPLPEVQ